MPVRHTVSDHFRCKMRKCDKAHGQGERNGKVKILWQQSGIFGHVKIMLKITKIIDYQKYIRCYISTFTGCSLQGNGLRERLMYWETLCGCIEASVTTIIIEFRCVVVQPHPLWTWTNAWPS